MKARQYINMMGMAAAVLLSSCVKDTLYDTPVSYTHLTLPTT